MVKAILEGRKTQTWRVIKEPFKSWIETATNQEWFKTIPSQCPYGQPGDKLWVRETFKAFDDGDIFFKEYFGNTVPVHGDDNPNNWKWTPSIFMPQWASRITLEIINVRIEQVQDISLYDINWEGIDSAGMPLINDAKGKFQKLWNSINKKSPKRWEDNPWVWIIEFKNEPIWL